MLQIRTLGGLEISGGVGRDSGIPSIGDKRAALLAYLAVTGPMGPRRRDSLLAMFWPELDEERGRRALRQALYTLRQALGDHVLNGHRDEVVSLEPGAAWCDVQACRAALESRKIVEALDLVRGSFLEGFHLAGCPEFDHWVENQRRELRSLVLPAAWDLAEKTAVTDSAGAIQYAHRAARLDPDDEGSSRRLVRLLDQLGDRSGALKEYDRLSRFLADEYDSEPSPETQALIATIRERTEARPLHGSIAAPIARGYVPTAAERRTSTDRVSSRRKLGYSLVGAVTVVGLVSVLATIWPTQSGYDDLISNRVAVATFENRTGDPAYDALSHTLAERLSDGMTRAANAEVMTLSLAPRNPRFLGLGSAHTRTVRNSAAGSQAAVAVTGSLRATERGVDIRMIALDVAAGVELTRFQLPVTTESGLDVAIRELESRITGFTAMREDPRLEMYAVPARAPVRYEAYLLLERGMRVPARERAALFLRAFETDSTYFPAVIGAVGALQAIGDAAAADSLLDEFVARDEQLDPLDRALLGLSIASRDVDWGAAYRAAEQIVEYMPRWDWQFAAWAFFHGDYERVIEVLWPKLGSGFRAVSDYKRLTASLHFLGEHERELAAARAGRTEFPTVPGPLEQEVTALAALGEYAALDSVASHALLVAQAAVVATEAGIELLWHDSEEGAKLLEQALVLLDEELGMYPSRGGNPPFNKLWSKANTLLRLGRSSEAKRFLLVGMDSLFGDDSEFGPMIATFAEVVDSTTSFPEHAVRALSGPAHLNLSYLVLALGIAESLDGDRDEAKRLRELLPNVVDAAGRQVVVHPVALQAQITSALGDCVQAAEQLAHALRTGYRHMFVHRRTGYFACRHHPEFLRIARARQ